MNRREPYPANSIVGDSNDTKESTVPIIIIIIIIIIINDLKWNVYIIYNYGEHAWVQTVRTCILKRSAPFLNVPGTVRNEGRILHDIIINLV